MCKSERLLCSRLVVKATPWVQFPLAFAFFSASRQVVTLRRATPRYVTFLTSRGVTTTKISALSTGHGQGCAHCRQFGARNEDLVSARGHTRMALTFTFKPVAF